MAGQSFVDELAKKSPAYKLGVLAGILALLGLVYWQSFYSSLHDKENSVNVRYSRALAKNRTLKQRERQFDKLRKKQKQLERILKQNQVSLPTSAELPAFFVHLQKPAAQAGVVVKKWSYMQEEPVDSYIKVPLSVEVEGTFYQIVHYFKLLYEAKRIISVGNIDIGKPVAKDDQVVLTAKFIASTFRQPEKASGGGGKAGAASGNNSSIVGKYKQAAKAHQNKINHTLHRAGAAPAAGHHAPGGSHAGGGNKAGAGGHGGAGAAKPSHPNREVKQ